MMSRAYTLACLAIAIVIGLGGLGCVIAAVFPIIESQPDLELAYILDDPQRDFEYLGNKACNVTYIKRCWETTEGDYPPNTATADRVSGPDVCWEVHIAKFTAKDAGSRLYNSWPEIKKDGVRNCGKGCDDVDAEKTPSGNFKRGEQYPCWKARGPVDKHCQSPSKLSNPQQIAPKP
jgi:hypothetical protein